MNARRVAIFGATGVAGGGVLRTCLDAPEVAQIVAVTRRPLGVTAPKLREVHCEDFTRLDPIAGEVSGVDACFYCLGTSSSGVSPAQYRVITLDYALESARLLKMASPSHTFHFVSGAGTRVDSRFRWARVKGEAEQALKAMSLAGLVCWRPAMILADRPPNGVSGLARALHPLLGLMRFVPALSIEPEVLGCAMLELELEGQRQGTMENPAIRAAAARYLARKGAAAFAS
jgi:uncharacterized protein YbjT (DUF2867 family)